MVLAWRWHYKWTHRVYEEFLKKTIFRKDRSRINDALKATHNVSHSMTPFFKFSRKIEVLSLLAFDEWSRVLSRDFN